DQAHATAAAVTGVPRMTAPPQPPSASPTGNGIAGRRPVNTAGSGTALDFGPYTGWTIEALADHDPAYLEWLVRTPSGWRHATDIRAALARHTAERATRQTTASSTGRRRAFL